MKKYSLKKSTSPQNFTGVGKGNAFQENNLFFLLPKKSAFS